MIRKKIRDINEKGITLVVLVVTIIVLLILAAVSINMVLGENGIIINAIKAKNNTEIGAETESIKLAMIYSKNKDDNIDIENIKQYFEKNNNITIDSDDDNIVVEFDDSKRIYCIDKNGDIESIEDTKDLYPGNITLNKDGMNLEGDLNSPYEIWCIEDLVEWTMNYDKYKNSNIILCRNLNFKSKYSYINSKRTDFGDINGIEDDGNELITELSTGTGFKPIYTFKGIFDGKNHKISNIYISYGTGYANVAMIATGNQDSTIIKNLEISGEISGERCTAGIIASKALKVENCINNAKIKSNGWYSAGIAGETVREIDNCINNGEINGFYMVGGIYATDWLWEQGININNCINNGNLIINDGINANYGVGGIAGGLAKGNIKKCVNNGEMDRKNLWGHSGGILGCLHGEGVNIQDCNVTKVGDAAGIVGHLRSGKLDIENCSVNVLGNVESGIIRELAGGYYEGFIMELNLKNTYVNAEGGENGIIGTIGNLSEKITTKVENVYVTGKFENGVVKNVGTDSRTERIIEMKNVYYDSSKIINQGQVTEGVQGIKIKNNNSFIDILNNNIGNNLNWKKWKMGDAGYPIFN